MKDYHYIWLSKHPHRTKEWLLKALKDGFDIHHLDGDHNNNCPENLVLIEHVDHIRLHGGQIEFGRMYEKYKNQIKAISRRLEIGGVSYSKKSTSSLRWEAVGLSLNINPTYALKCAKEYAQYMQLPWPLAAGKTPKTKARGGIGIMNAARHTNP